MKLKREGGGVPIFSNGYMLERILSLLLGGTSNNTRFLTFCRILVSSCFSQIFSQILRIITESTPSFFLNSRQKLTGNVVKTSGKLHGWSTWAEISAHVKNLWNTWVEISADIIPNLGICFILWVLKTSSLIQGTGFVISLSRGLYGESYENLSITGLRNGVMVLSKVLP